MDVTNADSIKSALEKFCPDIIFYLSAQSSVALSWKKPVLTAQVNSIGCINLLESVRTFNNNFNKNVRIIIIGTGEEYGIVKPEDCPVSENTPLNPANIYSVTKVSQEMTAKVYAKAYNMDIVMTRSFNHSGPGQPDNFVISGFCRQIAEIESGLKEPVIYVGNLSAKRDFTDVRDVVRAYRLLAEKGRSGCVYNVGRGKAVSIREILETALSLSEIKIEVVPDKSRMRPSDVPLLEPDVSKIFSHTGWRAEISLEKTVSDTLAYWRNFLRK